ncbi:MAG TPA: SAM-dependent methyltransferase [Vitreimonas sp.]|nr:SAM-dependent methyltransferase [Vitreimonas sp.]
MNRGNHVDIGLQRHPPGRIEVGDEPELVDRLRAEIASHGPVTFARFMERALYEPGLGYYRRPRPGPGRAGDFLTAPETHPIFGRAVARQLHEVWDRLGRPDPFVLREHGAGTGTLAVTVLDGLAAEESGLLDAIRYEPVEIEAFRLAALAGRLAEAGHGGRHAPAGDAPIVGVVLANEVLDALPVHAVERRSGRLLERFVDWQDGGFVETVAAPSTPALAARLEAEGIELIEGQRAEISLRLDPWIQGAAASLERGLLLLVDYGHPAPELYGPSRRAGTLTAYVNHRAHHDPLVNVGRQDLTAHVDVTAVERAAAAAGLVHLGTTTQAEFLVGLGVDGLLREARENPGATLQGYLAVRSALVRLLDPAVTGRFRVMAFARGLPADVPLGGLGFRLPPPDASRTPR